MPTTTTPAALPVAAPFDFDLALAFFSGFSPMAGEQTLLASTFVGLRRDPLLDAPAVGQRTPRQRQMVDAEGPA